MDFSSSNCCFWLCICNYRCTFCCGNGAEFKGILEVWSCALAFTKFCQKINRKCIFHFMNSANGPVLTVQWDLTESEESGAEVSFTEFTACIENSQANGDTYTHSVSLSFFFSHMQLKRTYPHSYYILTSKQTHTPDMSRVYLLPWKRR